MTPILGRATGQCYLRFMGRALSRCGVILAAGESSRMGRDKALLPWPPLAGGGLATGCFLSAAINLFNPYVDVVLVVAGKNEPNLTPIVYANGASLVVNPEPERGQFSSLQTGLQEVLNRGRDAALITLVDRPPVKPATVEALDEAFERAIRQWKWCVVPEYHGVHGHPFLAAREMIEAFLKAPSSSSARDVQQTHQDKIVYVPIDDPLLTANIDTPEQYAALPEPALH
ncbi:MAG TPA: nucleotidyltransferase family protein [Terriglobales bacterium]|nr:nucleotidyltransferase family protein [Terriglobales bacterium]